MQGFPRKLNVTARLWRGELDRRLRPTGLSGARWILLVHLSENPDGLSQWELAERAGIRGPTLVRQLDQLQLDGWIERTASADDRRLRIVRLREDARPRMDEARKTVDAMRSELLDEEDKELLSACYAMFDRIIGRLERSGRSNGA